MSEFKSNLDRMGYQILLKAIPLQERKLDNKEKSDIAFSTDSGKKLLFKLFKLIAPELYRPLEINQGIDPVKILFIYFADSDLSTKESINNAINNYLKDARDYDLWLEKITKIVISLRKQRIQFMEHVMDKYLENEEQNNNELLSLCQNRRIDLGEF